MSMRPIVKDSIDQSVVIRIVDSTTGLPETAVEHDTSGIDLWYRREGATKTSITEAALAALGDLPGKVMEMDMGGLIATSGVAAAAATAIPGVPPPP